MHSLRVPLRSALLPIAAALTLTAAPEAQSPIRMTWITTGDTRAILQCFGQQSLPSGTDLTTSPSISQVNPGGVYPLNAGVSFFSRQTLAGWPSVEIRDSASAYALNRLVGSAGYTAMTGGPQSGLLCKQITDTHDSVLSLRQTAWASVQADLVVIASTTRTQTCEVCPFGWPGGLKSNLQHWANVDIGDDGSEEVSYVASTTGGSLTRTFPITLRRNSTLRIRLGTRSLSEASIPLGVYAEVSVFVWGSLRVELRNVRYPGSAIPYGAGCPGTNGIASHGAATPAALGSTAIYELHSGPLNSPTFLYLGASNTTFLGLGLPLNLAFLGAPCDLLTSIDATIPAMTDATGYANIALPVPASLPAAVGARFYSQFVSVEPLPVNPLGLTYSNGLVSILGGPL